MESKTKIKARQKRYNQTDKGKESLARRQERYGETVKGRAVKLYASIKQRATIQGLPFTITRKNVEKRLLQINGRCEVTDTPLSSLKRTDVRQNPFAPTLDQKIAGKGYTPDNIQIVAVWYHRMKSDLTDREALQILMESNAGILWPKHHS